MNNLYNNLDFFLFFMKDDKIEHGVLPMIKYKEFT